MVQKIELWKSIRKKVMDRAAGCCECCGRKATQVHHRDYRPRVLRGENLLPLVSICSDCHNFIHRIPETGKVRDSWQDQEEALANIYHYGQPLISDRVNAESLG
jgi:5-methylcytosine-specific restriction endonuclease McrA